jgi:hypothetical protein
MAGDIIGALRVVLGVDSARLDSGLKSAESSVSRFAKNVTTIAAGIKLEAILTSAFNSIAHAIKKSVLAADDMGKMAEKVGIPVETFSELAYAAKLADVPIDTLKSSLIFLSKQMAQAAIPGTAAAKTFKAMGLEAEVTKGQLKPLSQMFTEVVGKLGSYTEGAGTNALAVRLLGKAGAELAPLFRDGAEGIRVAAEEARKFGIIITQDMVNSSKNFKDNMDRLGAVLDGMILQISGPLATALEQLSNQLVDAAKDGNLMEKAGRLIGEAMLWAAAQVEKLTATLSALGKVWAAIKNALNEPLGVGIQKALDEEAAAFKDIESRYNKARETFQQNVESPWRGTVTDLKNMNIELGRSFANWMRLPPPIVDTGRAASGAAKGLSEAEKEARKAEAAINKLMEEGKRMKEDLQTPAEKYASTLENLNKLHSIGAIDAETFGRAVAKAKDEMAKATPAAQVLEQALTSAFDRFLDFSMSATEQLKQFGRELAKLAAMAAFKMLLSGGQQGSSSAGLLGNLFGAVGSGGLGGLFGFARGGAFRVGGSGGIDSQVVAFKATPGERVDVRTPGQQRDMGNGPVNVNAPVRIVNAFDAVDFLSKALGEAGGEKVILNYVRANPAAFRAALS